ncbi:uncharacterized protein LOC116437080 [Corvus moneduloides]|uniref:uncharacterized protein LOC116437080 n=1 Tax=Corvus moneduloides TaxID=1196302 RepID=UPI001363D76E|nr:uncharacterized protein LOC116437080 [Corvus moneduloides]
MGLGGHSRGHPRTGGDTAGAREWPELREVTAARGDAGAGPRPADSAGAVPLVPVPPVPVSPTSLSPFPQRRGPQSPAEAEGGSRDRGHSIPGDKDKDSAPRERRWHCGRAEGTVTSTRGCDTRGAQKRNRVAVTIVTGLPSGGDKREGDKREGDEAGCHQGGLQGKENAGRGQWGHCGDIGDHPGDSGDHPGDIRDHPGDIRDHPGAGTALGTSGTTPGTSGTILGTSGTILGTSGMGGPGAGTTPGTSGTILGTSGTTLGTSGTFPRFQG